MSHLQDSDADANDENCDVESFEGVWDSLLKSDKDISDKYTKDLLTALKSLFLYCFNTRTYEAGLTQLLLHTEFIIDSDKLDFVHKMILSDFYKVYKPLKKIVKDFDQYTVSPQYKEAIKNKNTLPLLALNLHLNFGAKSILKHQPSNQSLTTESSSASSTSGKSSPPTFSFYSLGNSQTPAAQTFGNTQHMLPPMYVSLPNGFGTQSVDTGRSLLEAVEKLIDKKSGKENAKGKMEKDNKKRGKKKHKRHSHSSSDSSSSSTSPQRSETSSHDRSSSSSSSSSGKKRKKHTHKWHKHSHKHRRRSRSEEKKRKEKRSSPHRKTAKRLKKSGDSEEEELRVEIFGKKMKDVDPLNTKVQEKDWDKMDKEWTEEQYCVPLPGQQPPIVKDRGKGVTLRDANYAKNVEHGRVLLKGLEKVIGTIVREDKTEGLETALKMQKLVAGECTSNYSERRQIVMGGGAEKVLEQEKLESYIREEQKEVLVEKMETSKKVEEAMTLASFFGQAGEGAAAAFPRNSNSGEVGDGKDVASSTGGLEATAPSRPDAASAALAPATFDGREQPAGEPPSDVRRAFPIVPLPPILLQLCRSPLLAVAREASSRFDWDAAVWEDGKGPRCTASDDDGNVCCAYRDHTTLLNEQWEYLIWTDKGTAFCRTWAGRCCCIRTGGKWITWNENDTGLLAAALRRFVDTGHGHDGKKLRKEEAECVRNSILGDKHWELRMPSVTAVFRPAAAIDGGVEGDGGVVGDGASDDRIPALAGGTEDASAEQHSSTRGLPAPRGGAEDASAEQNSSTRGPPAPRGGAEGASAPAVVQPAAERSSEKGDVQREEGGGDGHGEGGGGVAQPCAHPPTEPSGVLLSLAHYYATVRATASPPVTRVGGDRAGYGRDTTEADNRRIASLFPLILRILLFFASSGHPPSDLHKPNCRCAPCAVRIPLGSDRRGGPGERRPTPSVEEWAAYYHALSAASGAASLRSAQTDEAGGGRRVKFGRYCAGREGKGAVGDAGKVSKEKEWEVEEDNGCEDSQRPSPAASFPDAGPAPVISDTTRGVLCDDDGHLQRILPDPRAGQLQPLPLLQLQRTVLSLRGDALRLADGTDNVYENDGLRNERDSDTLGSRGASVPGRSAILAREQGLPADGNGEDNKASAVAGLGGERGEKRFGTETEIRLARLGMEQHDNDGVAPTRQTQTGEARSGESKDKNRNGGGDPEPSAGTRDRYLVRHQATASASVIASLEPEQAEDSGSESIDLGWDDDLGLTRRGARTRVVATNDRRERTALATTATSAGDAHNGRSGARLGSARAHPRQRRRNLDVRGVVGKDQADSDIELERNDSGPESCPEAAASARGETSTSAHRAIRQLGYSLRYQPPTGRRDPQLRSAQTPSHSTQVQLAADGGARPGRGQRDGGQAEPPIARRRLLAEGGGMAAAATGVGDSGDGGSLRRILEPETQTVLVASAGSQRAGPERLRGPLAKPRLTPYPPASTADNEGVEPREDGEDDRSNRAPALAASALVPPIEGGVSEDESSGEGGRGAGEGEEDGEGELRAAAGTGRRAFTGHENDRGDAFFDSFLKHRGRSDALIRAARQSVNWETFRKVRRHITKILQAGDEVGVSLLTARNADQATLTLAECIERARDPGINGEKASKSVLRGMRAHGGWLIRLAFSAQQILQTQTRAIDSLSCCVNVALRCCVSVRRVDIIVGSARVCMYVYETVQSNTST
jgi:hypothetical protein